jgi:glycosyltransferase involved in cell wall biosynthesis
VQELGGSGRFDLIHTEFVRAVPYTAALNGCPKVYDTVDSLVLTYRRTISAPYVSLYRRLVVMLELLKMRRFEPQVLGHYDRVLVSSPADRDALGRIGGDEAKVIPNGVDVDFFDYHVGERSDETIVFLGKMSYHVNVASILWFYHRVFPLIRRQRPGIKLKVLGRDPVSKIEALSADAAVEVTGSVIDVRPHLAQAAVSICPMVTGAGIQNKMLEAMAVGTPAVSTSIACQAVQAEPGRDLLVADEPAAFAEAVLQLLDDESLRCRLAGNARRYVEEYHNWESLGCRLEDVYSSLIS